MNRQIWLTLIAALQAWKAVNFNTEPNLERLYEERAYREAIDWLFSVEPKEDN